MYSYYLLASIAGKDKKLKQKYLWWGRYLTQFQMLQFVSCMLQAAGMLQASPYPAFIAKTQIFYMMSLLFLFMEFYIRKHHSLDATHLSTKVLKVV